MCRAFRLGTALAAIVHGKLFQSQLLFHLHKVCGLPTSSNIRFLDWTIQTLSSLRFIIPCMPWCSNHPKSQALLYSRCCTVSVATCATCATHGFSSERLQRPLCRFDRTVRPRNRSSEDPVSLRGHENSVCHDQIGHQHNLPSRTSFDSFVSVFEMDFGSVASSIDLLQDLKWKHPCLRLKHSRQIALRLCLLVSCCYCFSLLVNINQSISQQIMVNHVVSLQCWKRPLPPAVGSSRNQLFQLGQFIVIDSETWVFLITLDLAFHTCSRRCHWNQLLCSAWL